MHSPVHRPTQAQPLAQNVVICVPQLVDTRCLEADHIGGSARGFRWWRSLCVGDICSQVPGFDLGEGQPDGDLPLVAGDLA
jgi:hypothetical protein